MSAQTSAALATYADSIGQRGIASELQVGAEVGSR